MLEIGGYCIQNSASTDTPFLAVYPDIVTENIARLVSLFSAISQIRPHVKTHKCPQVVNLMLEAGSISLSAPLSAKQKCWRKLVPGIFYWHTSL